MSSNGELGSLTASQNEKDLTKVNHSSSSLLEMQSVVQPSKIADVEARNMHLRKRDNDRHKEAKMVTLFNFEAEMQEESKDAHFENLSGILEEDNRNHPNVDVYD